MTRRFFTAKTAKQCLAPLRAQLLLGPPLGAQVTVTPTDLGTIGGNVSLGRDINSAGIVVRKSGIRVQETHAFLWLVAAGHGGKSGRYERLAGTAFEYAFLLTQLGRS